MLETTNENWWSQANCLGVDPELFFPERDRAGSGTSVQLAKAVCRECEVSTECLNYALHNNEKRGIWGGMSGRERAREKHRRKGLT